MTQECTLKEAFIASKLDEYQPDWREGGDVTLETKNKIREYTQTHYEELFTPSDATCLTFRSIEKTIMRLRKKLGIKSKMLARESAGVTWISLSNNQKNLDNPVRDGVAQHAPEDCTAESCAGPAETKTIEVVTVSCTNPYCDKLAFITRKDKFYFTVTQPLRKGEFIRPYCSQECQETHDRLLRGGDNAAVIN